jgi:putative radical SAM enzyme (TIGR03279 family)
MQNNHFLTVDSVRQGSTAEKAGFMAGDRLISVNSHRLRDSIDFMFYSSEDALEIQLMRNGKNIIINSARYDEDFGLGFKPFRITTCRNNCLFCFVKQLPRGLRKTLYVKDEDYRMSFLYGNYITLANLGREDRQRIVRQRLSPLYISVHSTNRSVRNKMLGNSKASDILRELKFLKENKLKFNVQIVLCPGYNDGRELRQTISSLYSFYPYLLSIAVVPVGLTIHRKQVIRPVEKNDAEDALRIIGSFQKKFVKRHGTSLVYGADELYLKAERPLPPLREYGELHQIENGVGMVPLFLNRAKKLKLSRPLEKKKKFLTFTGTSFYPFLKKFVEKTSEKEGLSVTVLPVVNRFFGSSVTVSGLLTGRDVMKTLLDRADSYDMILVPDVALDHQDRFLDDVTLNDMQEALGIAVKKIISAPEGIVNALADRGNDKSEHRAENIDSNSFQLIR